MNLSLLVIAKDEIEQLRRIVDAYIDNFYEIVIVYDDDILKEMKFPEKVRLVKYEMSQEEKDFKGIFFDRKRNFATKQISGDYYFRLDTDDEIVGVDKINDVLEKAVQQNIAVVYCWYNYSRDDWGNVHAGHYRETIVKNSSNLFWNKPIHENILPRSNVGHNFVIEKDISINHLIDAPHAAEAAKRNIRYLLHEYHRDGDKTDPRTIAYLGRMFFTVGEFEKAQHFLERHIAESGWNEDRYMSWCSLAEISIKAKNMDDAMGCCFEAMSELPERPDAYLKLHDICWEQQKWREAVHWGKIGMSLPVPETFMLQDPSAFSWRPAMSMAHCYLMMDEPEAANKFFDIAAKAAPTLSWIVENKKLFKDTLLHKRFIENFIEVYFFTKEREPERLKALMDSVPEEVREHDTIARLINAAQPLKTWDKNEITIFCGSTPEAWAPPSVIGGVGGSEEAVIYMSQELQKQGYKVTVYCNCGEYKGTYSGVEYKPVNAFNFKDYFNIVIAWRNNIFKYVNVLARKKIVWLHDLPFEGQYKDEEQFDHLIVLSEYHKSLLKGDVKDNKIYVTTNGINAVDFKGLDKIKKQPHRVIYASSYDRGLEEILNVWGEVKSEVPDAELHIYYGWNTFDYYIDKGLRDPKEKERLIKLMDQPGVYEHGRIGHKPLLREYAKSGLFVYPTNFAGEINCIALTKAKATGCLCITNDKFVLPERNDEYVVKDQDGLRDMMIGVMQQNIVKNDDLSKYIEDNSWETVATDWKENLLAFKRKEYKDLEEYREEYSGPKVFEPVNMNPDGTFQYPDRYAFVGDFLKEHKQDNSWHLDIGCSDGALSILINKLHGIPADGLEVDKRATRFANSYAKDNNCNCKFYTGLVEEFEPWAKYTSVSMLEVLEHVIDPKAVLDKLESFVGPGGYVFISTPDKNGYFGEDNFNPQHINHYDKESLEWLIGKERIIKFNDKHEELLEVVYKV